MRPSLLETQRAFAAALKAPADAGMRAYRANVWGNWSAALAGAYPIVRKIVGEAFFEALAREYARAHGSASGDLNEYGARLADFVAEHPDTLDLPYLPDVARMEWLAHRAYYAADRPAFDPSRIDALRLAPGCALLESPWPLARIWQVHQDDYPGEFAVDLRSGAQRVLVHRPNWRAEVQALDAGDYLFLKSLDAGLGSALQAAAGDPAFDPAQAPAYWVGLGVLTT
jgi:hypothetical protein